MNKQAHGHHGQVGQDYFNLIWKKYFVLYFIYFKMTFFGVRPVRYILNLSVNTLKDIPVSIFIMENNKIIIKDYFESK